MVIRLLILWLLLVPLAASSAQPYPEISNAEWEQWKRLLVVAEIEPGEYHEAFPCPENHICMDPPPFWFKAKVASTVYGAAVASELRVSTTSHYGMAAETKARGPYLLSLRSDGEKYVMPRYAKMPLMRDKQGALYLMINSAPASPWLPCGVSDLREEIFQENFPDGGAIAKRESKRYKVRERGDFYHFTRKGAWPRYAIPIERLRSFLEKAGPDVQMSCKEPETRPATD